MHSAGKEKRGVLLTQGQFGLFASGQNGDGKDGGRVNREESGEGDSSGP